MKKHKPNDGFIGAGTLITALMFLMTRYAHNQDKTLIQPIIDHFDWLENHPGLADTQLQKVSSKLRDSWFQISSGNPPCKSCSQRLH